MSLVFNMVGGGGGGIKLASISITTPPAKTTYTAGETFDPAGMVVEATYSNGAKAVATGYSYTPSTALTDDTTAVTIQYTEGGVTKTAKQAITVVHRLNSIAITTQPNKTVYEYGDSFASAGMVVRATYSDGATANVTGYTTSPSTLNKVGEQTITVSYTERGITKTTTLSVTVKRKSISTVPSQSGTLTYTGSAQSPSWSNYNPETMTLGGVTTGTNAGSYNATFTPKEGYAWSDGTNEAKTVVWSIGRATINAKPSQSGTLTYTGSAQSPKWKNYDSSKMTIGGTTSGTNAGSYNATFTPTANYRWSDGTTTGKQVVWTIGKAAGRLSISPTSMTLDMDNKTKTITVTRPGDGAITASSNTDAATVSVSGNIVTVTGKASGNATITISVAEGTNYTAPSSKKCDVTVQFLPAVLPPLNNCTWAQIREISDTGQAANYWAVGDKKTITINGKIGSTTFSSLSMDVFILGFNHNSAKEGGNSIHFLIGMNGTKIVGLFDSMYGPENNWNSGTTGNFVMNTRNTNSGGWNGSYMRNTLLGNSNAPTSPLANSYMAALPSDLRAVMKSVTKYSDNTGGSGNATSYVTATTDYLFLLSEFEVQGTHSYANSAEQTYQLQYDYFKSGNSKIAYKYNATGTAVLWWLRSVYSGNTFYFCRVANDGSAYYNIANYSLGLVPGFVV